MSGLKITDFFDEWAKLIPKGKSASAYNQLPKVVDCSVEEQDGKCILVVKASNGFSIKTEVADHQAGATLGDELLGKVIFPTLPAGFYDTEHSGPITVEFSFQ